MQTCSLCNASSPDSSLECLNCKADLNQFSTRVVSLQSMVNNPRVRLIRVTTAHDSCPHCYELMKTYPKEAVPLLPHEGCSYPGGCRCFYEPVLDETAIIGKVVS
jgi:hypothetical protein